MCELNETPLQTCIHKQNMTAESDESCGEQTDGKAVQGKSLKKGQRPQKEGRKQMVGHSVVQLG